MLRVKRASIPLEHFVKDVVHVAIITALLKEIAVLYLFTDYL